MHFYLKAHLQLVIEIDVGNSNPFTAFQSNQTLLWVVCIHRKLNVNISIKHINMHINARNVLSHQGLVTETIEQCSQRFKPQIRDIKKSIDSLIDRQYIERRENNKYVYLP